MSSISSDITYFMMENNFPTPCPTCNYLYCTQLIRVPPLRNLIITNQPTTNPIASLIVRNKFESIVIDQPTTQPIYIFVLVMLLT